MVRLRTTASKTVPLYQDYVICIIPFSLNATFLQQPAAFIHRHSSPARENHYASAFEHRLLGALDKSLDTLGVLHALKCLFGLLELDSASDQLLDLDLASLEELDRQLVVAL